MTVQTVDRGPVETVGATVPGDLWHDTIPQGLTVEETIHYRRGFDRGARAFTKQHGGPAVVHDEDNAAPAPGSAARRMLGRALAESGRAYRVERHPVAHKAGMSSLKSYLRRTDQLTRLGEIVDPAAPVKAPRKSAARKPVARIVPAPLPEPAESTPVELTAGVVSDRVMVVHVTDTPTPVEPATRIVRAPLPTREETARFGLVAGSASVEPVRTMTHAERKAARRALAAELRAQGVRPAGEAWIAACREAGIPGGAA